MKRWIIRSFFIGLLLLCVGGWAVSYKAVPFAVGSGSSHTYSMFFLRGGLYIVDYPVVEIPYELPSFHIAKDIGPRPASPLVYYFGCNAGSLPTFRNGNRFLRIPCWFISTLSTALLGLVWRKTRPKAKGRAFPVELAKPDSGRSSD